MLALLQVRLSAFQAFSFQPIRFRGLVVKHKAPLDFGRFTTQLTNTIAMWRTPAAYIHA